jgi:regulator of replication initiation timing
MTLSTKREYDTVALSVAKEANDTLVAVNEQFKRDLDTCVGLQGVIHDLSNEKRDLITENLKLQVENENLSLQVGVQDRYRSEAVAGFSDEKVKRQRLLSVLRDLVEGAEK